MATYSLTVNGTARSVDVPAGTPLLWVLRDTLGLMGTKYGCGVGECGCCTVLADGVPIRSCVTTVAEAVGKKIVTIEGLPEDHPVPRAWIAEEVPQCGYCQSGQVLAAAALLEKTPRPTDADIDAAMGGLLCRCGTYPRIRRAIHRAAKEAGHE